MRTIVPIASDPRPPVSLAIIAGRYHDRFARVDGTWQFADRLIFIDLLGDLRFHLKFAVFGS